jgi:hypothetical protein
MTTIEEIRKAVVQFHHSIERENDSQYRDANTIIDAAIDELERLRCDHVKLREALVVARGYLPDPLSGAPMIVVHDVVHVDRVLLETKP